MSNIDILSDTTIQMFATQFAPLLSSFYKCRVMTDLTKKTILPNKETWKK